MCGQDLQVPLIFGYLLSDAMQSDIKKFTGEVYKKATEASSAPASSSKAKPKADTSAASFSLVSDMFT